MARVISLRDRALQSRDAIELLASKWRITILHLLREGPLRTTALQGAMPGVSPKVLTQTLRGMERDGLVLRDVLHVVPAHVEYRLTSMGESLLPLLTELCHWAKAHSQARDIARARFAATPARPSRPRRAAPTRTGTR